MDDDLHARQEIEIDFWKQSPAEAPDSDSLENLTNKFAEARILLEKIPGLKSLLLGSRVILEIGGGQGWAACLVKRLFRDRVVITSDISRYAVASVHKWEYLYRVHLNGRLACKSHEIPLPDESVDLVFWFAAAHHFATHRRTLFEVQRVLKSGGSCLYLHEPACRRYLYPLALWRVTRKRPEVPDDVLIYEEIRKMAGAAGLQTQLRFHPTTTNRRAIEAMYYLVLGKLPFLQRVVPCTADFAFRKPAREH